MKSSLSHGLLFSATLALSPSSTYSFSSVALPNDSGSSWASQPSTSQDNSPAVTSTAPWKIVLDIGREPLAANGMPFDWARSGCRLPLKIPCDLTSNGLVVPHNDVVSFTGPDGAVEVPVEGGSWELKDNSELALSVSFADKLQRRDVWIDAGSTLQLRTRVFSQSELDQLNQAFYDARESVWELGGKLNEMNYQQNEAPKKWNEETQKWEKRYPNINVFSQVSKRVQLMKAQATQQQAAQKRPDPASLSSQRGQFPGQPENELYYVQKGGTIAIPGKGLAGNDAVVGTWYAEPITNQPVSYRG